MIVIMNVAFPPREGDDGLLYMVHLMDDDLDLLLPLLHTQG